MHQPELLIMDEPTNGLDPLMQQVFYGMVQEMKKKGKTVFVSSHNLNEVQKICDRAAFIRDGNLVAIEEISGSQDLNFHRYIVEFTRRPLKKDFKDVQGVSNLRIDKKVMYVDITGSVDGFVKALAKYNVVSLDEQETTLEEIFMHYYEEDNHV